ncbi:unnamed protein product [Moneuplotes crassus]|uniref:Uncharacterized protein n=1 Tax=Euplotes crassus TaxID=5936 RepID=A0AAD1U710_EUPCR|nr:unnamed protein product [Moneuplotes crassus]
MWSFSEDKGVIQRFNNFCQQNEPNLFNPNVSFPGNVFEDCPKGEFGHDDSYNMEKDEESIKFSQKLDFIVHSDNPEAEFQDNYAGDSNMAIPDDEMMEADNKCSEDSELADAEEAKKSTRSTNNNEINYESAENDQDFEAEDFEIDESSSEDSSDSEYSTRKNQRKGEFSSHFNRKDILIKKCISGSKGCIKHYFSNLLSTEDAQQAVDYHQGIDKIHWIANHLLTEFKDDLDLWFEYDLTEERAIKVTAIVVYLLKCKYFEEFIKDNLPEEDWDIFLDNIEEFRHFGKTSDSREKALKSEFIHIAKLLMVRDEIHVKAFWEKLLERKNASIPDHKAFKGAMENILGISLDPYPYD